MSNPIFDHLREQLAATIGGSEDLGSGSGTRFRSVRFGRCTVYRRPVAAGNGAEVAFHPQSLASAAGMSEADSLLAIHRLQAATGREININPQHRWLRVGVATADDVERVIAFVQSMHAIARARR